jgi:uncharacterized membrane protein
MKICTSYNLFEVHQSTPRMVQIMSTTRNNHITVWESPKIEFTSCNFQKTKVDVKMTPRWQIGRGWKDDPLPFFMKARCCYAKEDYCNS